MIASRSRSTLLRFHRAVVLAASAAAALTFAAAGSPSAVAGMATVSAGTDAATTPAGTMAPAVELTRVSRDPYTNPAAFHRTELEPDTFAWGDTIVAVFQTGRYSNGGSTDTGYATTLNGGKTWRHGFLPGTTVDADPPGPYARVSDPSIAYDAKHDVWLANSLTVDNVNSLIVNRSTDGGKTFSKPVVISTPPTGADYDKSWISCDNWADSPSYGNCYSEVDDYVHADTVLMFTSTDGGKSWKQADVEGGNGLGGQPVSQPDGTVIVPFSGDFTSVESIVSKDGGKTFDGPYTVSTTTDEVVPFIRTEPLPTAEVAGDGTVYVVWQDCRFRSGCATNDMVISSSKDGKNWSKVERIPIDGVGSTVDHFVPGLGVDRATSGNSTHLALTYYYFPNNTCDFDTCRLYAGFVSSTDAGAHWSKPQQVLGPIKLKSLPNAGGRFVGDYVSTAIVHNRAFPVIADAEKGTCTTELRSCAENMVAPSDGLAIKGGSVPMGAETPVTGVVSDRLVNGSQRAF